MKEEEGSNFLSISSCLDGEESWFASDGSCKSRALGRGVGVVAASRKDGGGERRPNDMRRVEESRRWDGGSESAERCPLKLDTRTARFFPVLHLTVEEKKEMSLKSLTVGYFIDS